MKDNLDIIEIIRQRLDERSHDVNEWFHSKTNTAFPIYSSFDIRNAGYKTIVIDSNVFPAGFNNLMEKCYLEASVQVKLFIETYFKGTKKIGLVAEYVNNPYYYDNIAILKRIFEDAGYMVELGSMSLTKDIAVSSFSKGDIHLIGIKRNQDKLQFDSFIPDLIVLNDDFSVTDPSLLKDCSQYIAPRVNLGWFQRKKHKHFAIKNELVKEIAQILDIDPWWIGAYFEFVDDVNFKEKKNFDAVAEKIDSVIAQTQGKYDEYGINEKPFVFVKGSFSTYGMNAIPFNSKEEFLAMNSDQRKKMDRAKGGRKVTEVIVQEGVITKDVIDAKVTEPVVYCIGCVPIGGFFRMHTERSERENLNTRGMTFTPHLFCPMSLDNESKLEKSNITKDKISVYKFITRLGVLAIGKELEDLQ